MGYIAGNTLVLNNATMNSPSGSTPLYPLRAGAKGRGTTRDASLNVGSVTRIAQGRYRLNLSTATSSNAFGACTANNDRSLICNCKYNTTSRFYFAFRGTNDDRYDENGNTSDSTGSGGWGVVVGR
ncbi:hypothetical protein KNU05_gp181 [Synechococcus virus S-PRM1]|uniref:Uncharacterized protein n=1 Tax=Synechococcus virus S-PRM1 TaxID=2100130 RepID=A0A346FK68_9CAUD|nr:hypothetical protein KNU05_gp181 [Synechococcus virus S-PRM1]AXN58373.1 hypothetical protein [Synechococcus virus S-PRM1]